MSLYDRQASAPGLLLTVLREVCLCGLLSLLANLGLILLFLGSLVLFLPIVLSPAQASGPQAAMAQPEIQKGLFFRDTASEKHALQAPVLQSDVFIDVNGPVVRSRVRQIFVNPTVAWQEGLYVFPLPERAAVDRMVLEVGDRRVEGEILEKEEAEAAYRQAAREGRRAGLLTGKRPNVFVTSVANIGPGETVVIEIEYQDKVELRDGRFELRFPMVVAPRYTPPRAAPVVNLPAARPGLPKAQPISTRDERKEGLGRDLFGPVTIEEDGPANPLMLKVRLNPGQALETVESLYHPIESEPLTAAAHSRLIRLAEGPVPADRDFVLTWVPVDRGRPQAAIFTEELDGDSYLLVSLMPPAQVSEQAPGLADPWAPRDLTFVIDTSGSMHGAALTQAKAAVAEALDRLRPGDRFNVIQFNHQPQGLYSGLKAFDEISRRRALDFVGNLVSDGGTNIRPALMRALSEGSEPRRLRQIVFLTDGAVSNESQLLDLIARRLGQARLFTVGIGSAPNSYFMRRAAELGRGSFAHIGDLADVKQGMTALFRKLESPQLTDLRIDWPEGTKAVESYPDPLPDLYAGEPVTFTARLPKAAQDRLQGEVRISGQRAGTAWSRRLDLANLPDAPGVAAVWARSKIVDIKDRRYAGETPEAVRAALVEVALAHRLVTAHTSLVAIDKTVARPATEALARREVPRKLPQGWNAEKVFGAAAPGLRKVDLPAFLQGASAAGGQSIALPKTATPAERQALTGLLLLAGSLLLLVLYWRAKGRAQHAG